MNMVPVKWSFAFPLLLLLFGLGATVNAQGLTRSEKTRFEHRQDSLFIYAEQIVEGREAEDRFRADSAFIKILVRSLREKNSFYFPFDSLATISRLYAPDSSFRIFTWQLKKDEYFYLQKGAIQMRTADGSLKLYPLHDISTFTSKPQDSVRSADNWIGAIYYKIILKTWNNKKIYTLLGFDDFTISSNKKWMDILTFDEKGQPRFGGPYFSFRNDSANAKPYTGARYNIEYKKEASTTFNYDPSLDMIVYDQLVSESEEPNRKETLVPDGDFEGFKWVGGQWVHVPKVFDYKLEDGQFPQDAKILNDAGGANEQKLQEQSDKNQSGKKKN